MNRRDELCRAEDKGWEELMALVRRIPPDRMEEVGVTSEWSVKDLLAHIGSWMAEAANIFEQMRFGTYEDKKLDIDGMNREFYEANRDLDLDAVKAELYGARNRMLEEFNLLPEVTPDAEEWFRDCGPAHIEEHLPDLRRYVEQITVSAS